MNTGVSIMDLGLNEFRLDLLEYMKQEPDIEHTPFGLHAVVPAAKDTPPGRLLKKRFVFLPFVGGTNIWCRVFFNIFWFKNFH
jgi:hypothetical protein